MQQVKEFTTCAGCSFRYKNKCHWFNRGRIIPKEIYNVGCKFRKSRYEGIEIDENVRYLIQKFKGELV